MTVRYEGKYDCAKCGHPEKFHKAWKACSHKIEYKPEGFDPSKDTPKIVKCSCKEYLAKRTMDTVEKPKTSTLKKMLEIDSSLVNQMLVLCGDLYDKTSSPPTKGTHKGDVNEINTNNAELINNLKSRILLLSMRIGERLWYPRGNPGSTTGLDMPRINGRKNKS